MNRNRKAWLSLGSVVVGVSLVGNASAGGLFLPGAGAVSTSRAGAGTVSSDDGEALVMNPANLAKAKGTTISLSASIISYAMSFTRTGTYDPIAEDTQPYEGTPFPTVKNTAKPPLGFGSFQPVPVFAIISDLGGKIAGLHAAIGVYAPNAYPFRDMGSSYVFNGDQSIAPPPTRYDILHQEAAVILPSVAVAYSITPKLDVGARFSSGFANLKTTTAIWAQANYEEWIQSDGIINITAKDNFVPVFGLGATFRPAPELELAANFTSQADIHAKGTVTSENGPAVSIGGQAPVIGPTIPAPGESAKCAPGGTFDAQKACVDFALPMNAQLGARYKFLDGSGKLRGDVELDLDWEHWGQSLVSEFVVTTDASAYTKNASTGMLESSIDLKPQIIRHDLKDTYGVRVGGSYVLDALTLRGGVGYDTRAAKQGWLRADLDGMARTTLALGAGYKVAKWELNAGASVILEGTATNPGNCNPPGTLNNQGCDGSGQQTPVGQRGSLDPLNPTIGAAQQFQSPVGQGSITSHYVTFMLGATTWF